MAAFTSACAVCPHDTQMKTAWLSRFSAATWPHALHVRLVFLGSTSVSVPPERSSLGIRKIVTAGIKVRILASSLANGIRMISISRTVPAAAWVELAPSPAVVDVGVVMNDPDKLAQAYADLLLSRYWGSGISIRSDDSKNDASYAPGWVWSPGNPQISGLFEAFRFKPH